MYNIQVLQISELMPALLTHPVMAIYGSCMISRSSNIACHPTMSGVTGGFPCFRHGNQLFATAMGAMQSPSSRCFWGLCVLLFSAVWAELSVINFFATEFTILHKLHSFSISSLYTISGYFDYTFLVFFSQGVMCHFQTEGTKKKAAYITDNACDGA